ncbi:MAG: phenylpyruvate tautomerase MIF-related protein [Gammaproteobacteria bacterium]|nr:phenylpyruvate tautomerase MIF-related protein [Gammaproteobacteria bacterium]
MPYLSIQTNTGLNESDKPALLKQASALVAQALGKPEQYVMVAIEPQKPMCFAGTDAPCAYLELKSIGLPGSRTTELSAILAEFMESATGIDKGRIYTEFSDAPRAFWGWNGSTF